MVATDMDTLPTRLGLEQQITIIEALDNLNTAEQAMIAFKAISKNLREGVEYDY